jgi:hypothetical protein
VLGDEMDRRNAQKRGSGKKSGAFDEAWMAASAQSVDEAYEAAVFRAKVEAAIRLVEKETDFTDFSIYRMRVLDGQSGKDVAASLGMSEPTISRRLTRVREVLKRRLAQTIQTYSFTAEELEEARRNGIDLNPTNADDALFDECIAEIYHRQMELRRREGDPNRKDRDWGPQQTATR